MKLSEVITKLENLIKEHGDIEAYLTYERDDYCRDLDFDFHKGEAKFSQLEKHCRCMSCYETVIKNDPWIEIW